MKVNSDKKQHMEVISKVASKCQQNEKVKETEEQKICISPDQPIPRPYYSKDKLRYEINTRGFEANFDKLIPLDKLWKAYRNIKDAINRTPLSKLVKISQKYQANINLKREDLQIVRSFKLRGAYTKFLSLSEEEKKRGVVCSSAGNHAQGVAYACNKMQVKGTIFMPSDAPDIKVRAVKMFGQQYVDVRLQGDTFDQALKGARQFAAEFNAVFVHAYDDEGVVAGQGTAAIEVLEDFTGDIDYLFVPIGGGGLAAGMASYFAQMSPSTIIIGCEPFGCPSMLNAIQTGIPSPITGINTFIDGAAVGTPGKIPHRVLSTSLTEIALIPEGVCCTALLDMYQGEGIVCEPAGALCVAALEYYKEEIKGKNVVCIVSGSNNDLTRMTDIKILSEIELGTRFYLLINFHKKNGALKEFLTDILNENTELLSIDYTQKSQISKGTSLVGLQLKSETDKQYITSELEKRGISYKIIQPGDEIFKLLL